MAQRNKLIIGNWKMFKSLGTASQDFSKLVALLNDKVVSAEIGIAAPSLFLPELSRKTNNKVAVYAQNAHWAKEGAFTGEISANMLKDISIAGSLVAHSERRQMFGETNESAGKRVGALLKLGLKSVLCVGETLAQREAGQLKDVLSSQIQEALLASGLSNSYEFIGANPHSPLFSIAYEPVWAIGTGKAATPVEAQQAHEFIRQELARILNPKTAETLPILYGGSVKPANANEFLSCADVDGALVGGASLNPEEFVQLCR